MLPRIIIYIILPLTFICQAHGQNQEYKNDFYRFKVEVPKDWELYGQIINDTIQQKAIADWGLPLIYSELEKTDIENAISITAYKRSHYKSWGDVMMNEVFRKDPTHTDMAPDSVSENARIIYHDNNGLEYKGKSYFVYKNGIGYIINFMATPGTYDKNIKVFEEFYTKINFF